VRGERLRCVQARGETALALEQRPYNRRHKADPACIHRSRRHQGTAASRQPHPLPRTKRTMDNVSARALLLCSKDPLGQCGKVILDGYVDDLRAYAHESHYLPQHAYQPRLIPADRCRWRRGGGRCKGRVSPLAVCQLCNYHQTRHPRNDKLIAWSWRTFANDPLFHMARRWAVRARDRQAV